MTKCEKDVIQAFEKSRNVVLPSDYVDFLRKKNGGRPVPNGFRIADLGEEALVQTFFGCGTAGERDLAQWLDEYADELPSGFLIIGCDPGANFIILGSENSESPGVYYWDHSFFFDASDDDSNTYLLASNFTEFLQSLHTISAR